MSEVNKGSVVENTDILPLSRLTLGLGKVHSLFNTCGLFSSTPTYSLVVGIEKGFSATDIG